MILVAMLAAAFGACSGGEDESEASSGMAFPDGFVWGIAMSAFQTEGHIENDYTDWIAEGGSPEYGEACNSYELYAEDTALAADLGVQFFRMSIEWSRIEPERDVWNMEELQHYRDFIETIRAAGMEPLVTIHHFTNPKWVAAEGYWGWTGVVDEFSQYAAFLAENLGDVVDHWNAMNEPMVYVSGFSLVNVYPGGALYDMDLLHRMFYNVVFGNAGAAAAFREKDAVDADGDGEATRIWLVQAVSPVYSMTPGDATADEAADNYDYFYNKAFVNALTRGELDLNADRDFEDDFGDAKEGVYEELANSVDYIGLNYYARAFVMPMEGMIENVNAVPCMLNIITCGDPTGINGDNNNEIYPPGIYRAIAEFSDYGYPIYISENGMADANDDMRPSYIITHLMQVHRAIADGYDVRGYLHWSLLDNYEWALGYSMKFGLYEVNFDTFERTPRPSVELYEEIIKGNKLTAEMVEKYDIPEINPMTGEE